MLSRCRGTLRARALPQVTRPPSAKHNARVNAGNALAAWAQLEQDLARRGQLLTLALRAYSSAPDSSQDASVRLKSDPVPSSRQDKAQQAQKHGLKHWHRTICATRAAQPAGVAAVSWICQLALCPLGVTWPHLLR